MPLSKTDALMLAAAVQGGAFNLAASTAALNAAFPAAANPAQGTVVGSKSEVRVIGDGTQHAFTSSLIADGNGGAAWSQEADAGVVATAQAVKS